MKSKRLVVAGVIAAVCVYFAPGVFAAEDPIDPLTYPETYYPAASPDINPKLDKGTSFIAEATYYPATSPDIDPRLDIGGTPCTAGPSCCTVVSPCK